MESKRRYKRFSVDLMSISGRMVRATKVTLLGLSSDEVTLKADMRLNMGSHYSLKLHDSGQSIALRGIVQWSSLTETRQSTSGDIIPQYKATIKLANVSDGVLTKLASYIEQEASGSMQVQDAGRSHADGQARVLLGFAEGYKVKKISLGGALIETSNKPPVEKRFPMEISLPGGASFKFYGRVASCSPAQNNGADLYDVGIEFLDMPEDDKKGLSEFVDRLEGD